jgi:hypothetical protein
VGAVVDVVMRAIFSGASRTFLFRSWHLWFNAPCDSRGKKPATLQPVLFHNERCFCCQYRLVCIELEAIDGKKNGRW